MVDVLLRIGMAAMFFAFTAAVHEPLRDIELKVGDAAPPFTVTADNGERVSVSDFHGKALLVTFWASWCEPCVEETPSLNALARTFRPAGLVVLGISQDESAAAYREFLRRTQVSFLTLRQPAAGAGSRRSVQSSYGTSRIPESFLIDRAGRIRAKFISNQNWMSPEVVAQVQVLL